MRNVKGFGWNHKRVYRIYCDLALNLRIKPRRRLKRNAPEPLKEPTKPNQVWSTDITYIRMGRGFMMDWYSRCVLSWRISNSMDTHFCVECLAEAIERYGKPAIFNSDQIEQLEKSNPKKYQHTILGGWLDKAEGVVFTNWKFGAFNPDNLQTSFGQDFGFSIDPTTLVEVAIDKSKRIIYVKEHLYKPKLTTSEIAVINKQVCGGNLIIADSAEPRLIAELQSQRCNIQPTLS